MILIYHPTPKKVQSLDDLWISCDVNHMRNAAIAKRSQSKIVIGNMLRRKERQR